MPPPTSEVGGRAAGSDVTVPTSDLTPGLGADQLQLLLLGRVEGEEPPAALRDVAQVLDPQGRGERHVGKLRELIQGEGPP